MGVRVPLPAPSTAAPLTVQTDDRERYTRRLVSVRSGWRVALGVLVGLLLLASACAPDPQVTLGAGIFERLRTAQADLATSQARTARACDSAFQAGVDLMGAPGQTRVQALWDALNQADEALLSACGRAKLLAAPATPSPVLDQSRTAWQAGSRAALQGACRPLATAAGLLRQSFRCKPVAW